MCRLILKGVVLSVCIALIATLVSLLVLTSVWSLSNSSGAADRYAILFNTTYLRLFVLPQYLFFLALSFVSCMAGRSLLR